MNSKLTYKVKVKRQCDLIVSAISPQFIRNRPSRSQAQLIILEKREKAWLMSRKKSRSSGIARLPFCVIKKIKQLRQLGGDEILCKREWSDLLISLGVSKADELIQKLNKKIPEENTKWLDQLLKLLKKQSYEDYLKVTAVLSRNSSRNNDSDLNSVRQRRRNLISIVRFKSLNL